MGWTGHLRLAYRRDGDRTLLHDRHSGPLRVLRSLYPEGPGRCHNVLVHPPGGIVGGDRLEIEATLEAGARALVTTPGATRFYRSAGAPAVQSLDARVADGARLEWLPLETLAHRGALAENRLRFELAPGGQMIGWDVLALGLPASGEAFDAGRFEQRIELPGVWLERAVIDGSDALLRESPLGLAGHTVLGVAWMAAGATLRPDARTALLEAAREAASGTPVASTAGATSPHERIVLLRVLAQRVEPAMALLQRVWGAWRRIAWGLEPAAPRVWRT